MPFLDIYDNILHQTSRSLTSSVRWPRHPSRCGPRKGQVARRLRTLFSGLTRRWRCRWPRRLLVHGCVYPNWAHSNEIWLVPLMLVARGPFLTHSTGWCDHAILHLLLSVPTPAQQYTLTVHSVLTAGNIAVQKQKPPTSTFMLWDS
jgi:hypothetical protein